MPYGAATCRSGSGCSGVPALSVSTTKRSESSSGSRRFCIETDSSGAPLKPEPLRQVELWCMRAIEAGLMVVKMDQVREVVVVTFCTEREFGDRQWERLHDSLLGWRDSIRGLLTVIEAAAPKPAPA